METKIRAFEAYCGVALTVTSVATASAATQTADDHGPATTENAQIVAKLHNDPLLGEWCRRGRHKSQA